MPAPKFSDLKDTEEANSGTLEEIQKQPDRHEGAEEKQTLANGDSLQPKDPDGPQPIEIGHSELTSDFAVEDVASLPDAKKVVKGSLEDKVINDTESESSEGDFAYQVGLEIRGYRRGVFKQRREAARKRLLQTVSYAALMEDRMRMMESEIVELRQILSGKQEAGEDSGAEEGPVENQELAACPVKLTWAEYNDKPRKPSHIIDLLIEKPGLCDNSLRQSLESSSRSRRRLEAKLRPGDQQGAVLVERIRINSKPLCEVMEEIMGKGVAPSSGVQILRPFKALFVYQNDLAKRCEELRAEVTKDLLTSQTLDDSAGVDDVGRAKPEVSVAIPAQDLIGEKTIERNSHEDHQTSAERVQTDQERKLRHLEALLKMMGQELKEDLKTHEKYRKREPSTILFDNLWHLFAPGDIIYNPKVVEAYQVLGVKNGREIHDLGIVEDENEGDIAMRIKSGKVVKMPFVISSVSIAFDGEEYGPQQWFHNITPFEGERRITDLECYPIEHGLAKNMGRNSTAATLKQSVSLQEALHERGSRFQELAKTKQIVHCEYRGMTLDRVPEQVDSHVIIDTSYYYETHANDIPSIGPVATPTSGAAEEVLERCRCGYTRCDANGQLYHDDRKVEEERIETFMSDNLEWLGENVKIDSSPRPEQWFLLPKQLWGFVLNSRSWHLLDINKIDDICKQTQSFEQLVLNPEHKKLIESQVTMHSTGVKPASGSVGHAENDRREDLVRGKGKGLIILLHGAPGVGKTSTAECVAEYTNRPLLSITCGDIGDTALSVQENLASNLSLAHRWGCVMLLDEADVFLSARSKTDMKRNAVVSVFLRVLEYYSGILFLTTNKVGTIDEAFKSRIHLSLFYPSLDADQTMKIWRLNLQRIRDNRKGIKLEMEELVHWASRQWDSCKHQKVHPWNGRQIRNACQTAAALAEFDNNGLITITHLKAVANASSEFDRYLKQVWGADDAHRAKINNERQDGFHPLQNTTRSVRDDYDDRRRGGTYDATDSYADTAYYEPSHTPREPRRRSTFSRRSGQAGYTYDEDYDQDQGSYDEDPRYGDSRRNRDRDSLNMPPPPRPQIPRPDSQFEDRQRPDSRRGTRRPSRARDHEQG